MARLNAAFLETDHAKALAKRSIWWLGIYFGIEKPEVSGNSACLFLVISPDKGVEGSLFISLHFISTVQGKKYQEDTKVHTHSPLTKLWYVAYSNIHQVPFGVYAIWILHSVLQIVNNLLL